MLGLGLGLGSRNGRSSKTLVNLLGRIGNFESDSNGDGIADGWATNGASSKSVVDNVQSFTNNDSYRSLSAPFGNVVVGDVFYACAWVKASSSAVNINLYGAIAPLAQSHSGSGNWEFLSVRVSYASASPRSVFIQDARSSEWTEIQCKLAHVFNLTADLGLGKELTKAEMDAIVQSNGYFESISI